MIKLMMLSTFPRYIGLAAAIAAANGLEAQERRGKTDAHRGGAASAPELVVGPERCSECHGSHFPPRESRCGSGPEPSRPVHRPRR